MLVKNSWLLFEPIAHALPDFIVDLKLLSLQCFFELIKDVEIARRQPWTIGWVAQNFPLELLQNFHCFFSCLWSNVVVQDYDTWESLAGCFVLIAFLRFFNVSKYRWALTIAPCSIKSMSSDPLRSKKKKSINWLHHCGGSLTFWWRGSCVLLLQTLPFRFGLKLVTTA